MLNEKRKGFTLIEILLVIVILAALSATMVLSSRESTYFAKANSIISTMTVVRDAALSYYTNNIEKEPTPENFCTNAQNYLGDKATRGQQWFLDMDGIRFTVEGRPDDNSSEIDSWYVECDFSVLDDVEEAGVADKLALIDNDYARLRRLNDTEFVQYTSRDNNGHVWLKVK